MQSEPKTINDLLYERTKLRLELDDARKENERLRRKLFVARSVLSRALDWFETHRVEVQKIGPGTIPTWVKDGWGVHRAALGEGQ